MLEAARRVVFKGAGGTGGFLAAIGGLVFIPACGSASVAEVEAARFFTAGGGAT